MDCIDLLSRIFSILADMAVTIGAPISIMQLIRIQLHRKEENTRTRCKATMDYWDEISKEIRELKDSILEGLDLPADSILGKNGLPPEATTWKPSTVTGNETLHAQVQRYLSMMERLAVGIKFHRYDIEVFDRLYGYTTIRMHDVLTPYLKFTADDKGAFFYGDFETMAEELKKVRANRKDIPGN